MDHVDDLVRRLALLRPDLAVVPRTMSPAMVGRAGDVLHARVDPGAVQAAWSLAIRECETDGVPQEVALDIDAMLASGFMSRLIREAYPADGVIFRTTGGSFTGEEMAAQIEQRTEIGRDYAASILRVCRDLLHRQAKRDAEHAREPIGRTW